MPVPPANIRSDADSAPPLDRRTLVVAGILLGALALLYFLTIPGNHAEAQDAFWYAYDVREKPVYALFHLHHLLYLPLMHLLYKAGPFPDAYRLMIGVDVLSAVATVGLLFFWLDRGLRLRRAASLFACAFLAFAYGFWRYAVETEVYLPALVLLSLLAWRVFRRSQPPPAAETWGGQVLTALLGAGAMLMHAPLSVPLAVVAVPVYLLLTRRWRALAVYGVLATVLVTAAYYTAFRMETAAHDPTLPPVPATFTKFLRGAGGEDPLVISASDVPKSAIGLGADVVASNYLFVIPKTRDKLFAIFPARNFAREAFTASFYGRVHAYFGLVLTVTLLGIIAFTAVARLEWSQARLRALFALPESIALLLWLGAYCGLVGIIEPENPENWICCLLPLAATAGLLVHFLYRGLAGAWLPWVFAGLLLTHNLVNGLAIIHNPASDVNVHRSAWVVANARAGDVVFTRDNEVFTRFLRYHTPAKVVNCFQAGGAATRELIEQTKASPGGARYLYLDVIEPPAYLRVRFPTIYDELAGLRQELQPTLSPTGTDEVKRLP